MELVSPAINNVDSITRSHPLVIINFISDSGATSRENLNKIIIKFKINFYNQRRDASARIGWKSDNDRVI